MERQLLELQVRWVRIMDLPKISLDGMKSKLGFSQSRDDGYGRTGRGDDDYIDDYGADYGEYGYDADGDYADGGYEEPGSLYEPYNQVTTRTGSSRRSTISSPRLVSMTDVRASTHLPTDTAREASRNGSSSYRRSSSSFRTLIDNTTPAPSSPAAMSSRGKERSESLDGLFGVEGQAAAPETPTSAASSVHAGLGSSPLPSTASSYDPFDSYSGKSTTVHTPSRALEIIKPMTYNDVERVAKILRAGDVAVLALGGTPSDLSKRVLDFSFGVASALDATVDLAAPKVFVIAKGAPLTDAEHMKLRSRGVM